MPEQRDPPDSDLLTTTEAANYLGVSRQTIASAAKQGEIGTKHDVRGARGGWIYLFTRAELDRWYGRERVKPGRPPKIETALMTPVMVV
jgi:excisionase family DNA binding protein